MLDLFTFIYLRSLLTPGHFFSKKQIFFIFCNLRFHFISNYKKQLEDLTVLKRSPYLLKNVKIGQDRLRLIINHILFYGGCGHFGQVT